MGSQIAYGRMGTPVVVVSSPVGHGIHCPIVGAECLLVQPFLTVAAMEPLQSAVGLRVGDAVASAIAYKPYGEVLVQHGVGDSAYGFAGEHTDSATSLLYLRARYYNPALKVFQNRDPWEGSA